MTKHHCSADAEGNLIWSSPLAKHLFVERCGGKPVVVKLDEDITKEARGFYWGAVVPAWFYLNPRAKWTTKDEAHENLKLEFNPIWLNDREGDKQKHGGSTEDFNREDYRLRWIEPIAQYIEQNYSVILDSEDFKRWYDSPDRFEGGEYHQTKHLRETYEAEAKRLYPWAGVIKI